MALDNEVAATQPLYCKDCRFHAIRKMKILPDTAICTRKRTIIYDDLVKGRLTRECSDMTCVSERYPELNYVLNEENPCGRNARYFEPRTSCL